MKTIRWTYVILMFFILLMGMDTSFAASTRKIKIKSVTFEGNKAFTNRRLYRVMICRPPSFFRSTYYRREIFEDDLKNIELFYRQNGYLEATISNHHVQIDSTLYRAHLTVTVSEGEITRIEGVSVLGNDVFLDDVLLQKINIQVDDPFRIKKIEEATVALITLYADNGFLDAEVKPDIRINSETHRALIDFNIKEKSQFSIDKIILAGLKKTRPKIVLRELLFSQDEIVHYSRLLETQRKIYLTGLFQSVFIRPQVPASGDSTKKDILIDLKENMSGEFNVAAGYGSIEKARGKIELFNNNLKGTARKLGIIGKLSFINRSVETSFTEPRTFGRPLLTDINMLMEYKEEPGYDLNRIGGRITFGRRFRDQTNITLTYRHENVKLKNIQVSKIPEKDKTDVRSLKLSLIHDTRNNLFNATSGNYFELSNEVGGFFSQKVKGFLRSTVHYKYFRSFNSVTVIASAVELGWIGSQSGLKAIPLNERFYTGGPNSIRGFEYEKVGPLDNRRIPIGGMMKFVWNMVEIRRTLYKMIGGVLFIDVGNVWSRPGDFSISDIRPASGFGFRINTPIGLARLDYGINLDRQKNEPAGKVYFSMGQAF